MGFDYTDAVHKLRTFKYTDEDGAEHWYNAIDNAVLLDLAERADNTTGQCYPGAGAIAARTCFSRKAVQRAVGNLKVIGFVTVKPHATKSTNHYTLNLKAITDIGWAQNEGKCMDKKPKRRGNFTKAEKNTITLERTTNVDYDESSDRCSNGEDHHGERCDCDDLI